MSHGINLAAEVERARIQRHIHEVAEKGAPTINDNTLWWWINEFTFYAHIWTPTDAQGRAVARRAQRLHLSSGYSRD